MTTCPAPRRQTDGSTGPCDRPAPDGVICHGCARYVERILAELPAWLGELETAVARQARVTGRGGGKPTKKSEQPLPFDPIAAELADRVRNELSTAIRHLCESRGKDTPRIERTADMAVWLVAHIDAIRQDEAAAETVAWARSLREAITWQIDNKGTRYAGPCRARVAVLEVGSDTASRPLIVTPGDETAPSGQRDRGEHSDAGESRSAVPVAYAERECGAGLRMRSGADKVTCRECGTVHDAADVLADVIQRNHEHMARASEISDWLTSAGWPIKAATIRDWAKRGQLYAWREDEIGRSLYRVGDVLDLVVKARTREEVTA